MEIQDGYIGYRYARQKYNANWYNANLDTKLRIDECAINDTINHLQDCKKKSNRWSITKGKIQN